MGRIKADRPRQATMADVARLAGVSTMTVSRLLANPAAVSGETGERIRQAIERLGYVTDRVAGSLSSRRTGFVAAVLPTLANTNFSDTAHGLTEALRPRGYQLLIGYTMYDMHEEERIVRAMLARRPEALVLAETLHTKATTQLLLGAGIPIVEIWEQPERPVDRAVGFSNAEAGRAAARHLIELGHRRIAALGPADDGPACDQRAMRRLDGFAAMLREAGLSDELVIRDGPTPFSFAEGAAALARLLERAADVTALFAVSDLSAVGALMECQRRGIGVPDRLSIMGFGDFEIGRVCVPSLTTVGVDARAIGEEAGRLILELLDADQVAGSLTRPAALDLGFVVIERGSTCRAHDDGSGVRLAKHRRDGGKLVARAS
jgi:LacI family transcriptional regulator, gluconate utilization system Gnt-I transcriptional repressor